jgi:NAD(P)-dependent dehydrogenase (short-subunit alcohol dehydrogenase family)
MSKRLDNKVAIVTAAGQGIGRACVRRFAAEGAAVVVNDVRADAAAAVAREITDAGGTALAAPGDVSSSEIVNGIVRDAVARFGRLDVMMNNAAAPLFGRVEDMSDAMWRTVFATTLDATFYGMRAALPVLAEHGGGAVINTASAAGVGGTAGLGAYGAAKAAVIHLTKTAALEGAKRGVRVNAICPGSIDTPPMGMWLEAFPGGRTAFERQIPVKRLGTPEEVASVALFLASDESSYVTGTILVTDGGVLAGIGPPQD